MKIASIGLFLGFSISAFATDLGDTVEQVLAERGKPVSQVARGDMLLLNYSDVSIKCEHNKVVEMKGVKGGYVSVVPSAPASGRKATNTNVVQGGWSTDYKASLDAAAQSQRNVFLFFTGSDWCGWCKKLNSEILSSPEFSAYADQKLVLVEVDFPRRKSLSAQTQAQNQRLSEQYGIQGYPTVVILNPKGEVVGQLGYQAGGPKPFIERLATLEP